MNFVRVVVWSAILGAAAVASRSAALAATSVASALSVSRGLPRPLPTELAPAEAASAAEIDAWLGRLTGSDAAARVVALSAIEAGTQAMVPAISKKLADLKRSADREAMWSVLSKARQGTGKTDERERPTAKPSASAANGKAAALDWLERLMATPRPQDAAWRDLAAVLALSRTLAHIESVAAGRELIGIFASFGEPVRVDVERQIAKLGEHAVAPLVETRHADNRALRAWAAKQLDVLGKTVPGEAVQTTDNQVLADVLRAYGRAKDADAARVVVSFANSDRAQVRDAAREAVVLLGDTGLWQLKESYESLTGKRPPDDWGWERTASELFAQYDKSRLAQVHELLDEGLAMEKAGRLEDMAKAFDKALARAPMLERRAETVRGYLALAKSFEGSDRGRALGLARKAARVDPAGPRFREAEAEVAFLEAEELASRGVVDAAGYARAVDLDPKNESAVAAFSRIKEKSDLRLAAMRRFAAGAAFVLALGLAGAAAFARRRKNARTRRA
jgi:tetratricopeptide (TPR) repeat protein